LAVQFPLTTPSTPAPTVNPTLVQLLLKTRRPASAALYCASGLVL
jgi:hypothetical protein